MYNRALLNLYVLFYMPIYEYRCQGCEHQFDTLQKMSADPLVECPECAEQKLVKLVSAPSFRLSGSGWYETDFKTSKDKKKNLVDSSSGSSSDSSSSKSKPPNNKASTKKSSPSPAV